jgi:hypothetical protein
VELSLEDASLDAGALDDATLEGASLLDATLLDEGVLDELFESLSLSLPPQPVNKAAINKVRDICLIMWCSSYIYL